MKLQAAVATESASPDLVIEKPSNPVYQVPFESVQAALILSRIPIVTPDVPEYEQQYYYLQSELEKRLMWTFPDFFYFKKGSFASRNFNMAQKGLVVKQPGVWYKKGLPDIKYNRERREKQELVIPKDVTKGLTEDGFEQAAVLAPRVTEFEEDTTSLKRKLPRTIYLLVKDAKTGAWRFPSFPLARKVSLHEIAEQGLREIGGVNLDTWTVSNTPAAVVKYDSQNNIKVLSKEQLVKSSEKQAANVLREYFIKSHILAGTFELQEAVKKDISTFGWFSKEEIKERVNPDYYDSLQYIIADY